MAEIKIHEGESIEVALKRFKKTVTQHGILSNLRKNSFFQTKSQKKRAKSKAARKRQRKLDKKLRIYEPPDFKPWVTDTTWPPDMTLKPDVEASDVKRYLRREETGPSEIQEEPSIYVAGIAEYSVGDLTGVIIVRNSPDENDKFSFPGGGLEEGESPEDGIVREFWEETGFHISRPSPNDIIYTKKVGIHTVIFYAVTIIGGTALKGGEIEEMRLKGTDSLLELIKLRGFRFNHARAFQNYMGIDESQKESSDEV